MKATLTALAATTTPSQTFCNRVGDGARWQCHQCTAEQTPRHWQHHHHNHYHHHHHCDFSERTQRFSTEPHSWTQEVWTSLKSYHYLCSLTFTDTDSPRRSIKNDIAWSSNVTVPFLHTGMRRLRWFQSRATNRSHGGGAREGEKEEVEKRDQHRQKACSDSSSQGKKNSTTKGSMQPQVNLTINGFSQKKTFPPSPPSRPPPFALLVLVFTTLLLLSPCTLAARSNRGGRGGRGGGGLREGGGGSGSRSRGSGSNSRDLEPTTTLSPPPPPPTTMMNLLRLRCPPCRQIHCAIRDPKRLECKGGVTTGVCGCCPACARLEGESCGGEFSYLGKCDRGLTCSIILLPSAPQSPSSSLSLSAQQYPTQLEPAGA